ncbi:MAG: gliding motility-associated C-terminal domain-containing protein [Lewinellaceae bacterium]|nr:gliding motility-associated C-terminal domain-containing protein [Lewinellaceae bacterium]
MRRLITIAVIGVLSFVSNAALAQQVTFSLTPATTNTTQGAQVCLDVQVSNFTNIVSFQYSINYDPAVLDFDMAQNFNLAGLTASNIGNPGGSGSGNLTISWLANDVTNGETVPNGTSIFQICFTAVPPNGTSTVAFSGTPTPIEVTNSSGIVNPLFNNASVVVGSGGGGGGGDLTFIASDETVANGAQVCVDVSVQNFTDIVSMQYSINYNASVLQFDNASGFNLPGMTAANFGNPTSGNITLSWLANDPINGQSVADGTVIFQLCFTAIGAGGTSSNISFSGSPVPVEVIDASGPVTPVFDNGSVTVTGGGGGGGGTDLTFIASEETAGPGAQVCVDVSVQNFDNIVSMQYSINYNPSILQFDNASGFNLPGFTAANVGNPSAGNITISWLANDPIAGQSVPDGTVIYQLCFTVLGSAGSMSNITFSGTPTPVEVTNPSGIITPVFDNGKVTVEMVIGPNDFALILGDASVQSGDSFCIDLSVQNFTDMVSMQFSINYPGNLLSYTGSQGFNLPGLNSSSIGNPGGPTSGNITLSWLADDVVTGETVDDGTVIVQLCFQAIGPNCSTADVVFSGTPTPIEVTDVNGNVPFNWNGATVVICDAQPLALRASDEVVSPGGTACVDITAVDGFLNITSMQFSITYDPSIVDFNGVQGITLAGMTSGDVGNPTAGKITVDWTSPSPSGTTVPDNTVLFQLCFDAIGLNGDVSPMNFSGTPLAIQIMNQTTSVPFMGDDGSVTIDGTCPPIVIEGVISKSCTGSGTGAVDITVTGGDDTYTYSWSNNETSEDINNLSAGTYTVTVSSCGTTASQSFTVGSFPAINVTPTIVDVACFGESSGAIFLTVQGSGPFSYSWSGPGTITNPTSQNITGLIAGDYTVTITDGNSCMKISNFLVKQPASALTANLVGTTPVSCFGESDGAIQVSAMGGTPGYTYNWTPSLPNIPNPTGLTAGTYNLQVVDLNSCTVSISNIQVAQPQVLNVILVNLVNETGAGNNGSIDISVTGGTNPYDYHWEGPNNTTYITQDITNLSAGTYNLTVTDDHGCTKTFSAEIIKPIVIEVTQVTHPCGGQDDGAIDVTVTGGDPPYAFFWTGPTGTGPFFTEDISGLGGGNYSLTVTDFSGSQASVQVTLIEPALPLEISSSTVINPSGPNTCNGAVVLNSIIGGTPPYTFYWSNTATTPTITNLCPATYFVTITDVNGCSVIAEYTVEFIPQPLILELNQSQNVSCNGEEDGVWEITIEGGVSPYTFSFSDGYITPSINGVVIRNDLSAGSYSCTISDSSPVPDLTVSRNISQPPNLTLSLMQIYPATGTANNGAVNITPTGGTFPYSYQWSNGSANQDPSNLADNCYSLNISDAHGCEYQFDNICVPRFEISGYSVTDNLCQSGEEGAIVLNVDGGINEPLTYTWTGPNGPLVNPDSNQVNNLPPGNYTVYVTDALGVTTVAETIEITYSSDVVASASATSDYNGHPVSCPGETDGAAEVVVLQGEAPFNYQWMGGLGNQSSVSGLGVGTYFVIVTDGLGCIDTTSVTLDAPAPVSFQAEITDVGCSGSDDGEISLKVGGGAGELSYLWDDPKQQTTNPAIFLQGDIYTVTITDGNGCKQVASFEVMEPAPLQVDLVTSPDDGTQSGTIAAVVSGGTAPYTYTWNTGRPGDTGDLLTDLPSGEFFVLVKDANGCTATAVGFIANSTIDCLEFRNVITPDGDGMNEEFQINCLNLYQDNTLQIFNRWGQLVYETDNYANDWTGVNRLGEDLPEGAYFFVFNYTDEAGSMQQLKGHITLIR